MKITLKSPFNLNTADIETRSTTLGALLEELSTNIMLTGVPFFDRISGEVYADCDVQVNGQPYWTLAGSLATELRDGDRLEIIIFTLAGG